MRNEINNILISWRNNKSRLPLILRGARQVGKTYLMKSFASANYDDHIYLNFEQDKNLKGLFASSLDPKVVLKNISLYFEKKIDTSRCLLIFDEIQESPDALNSLKYFSESGIEHNILCAGSLLGVKLSSKGFPVGKVDFIDVYPLSFLDFLRTIEKKVLADHLATTMRPEPFPEALHLKLLNLLKDYFYVGGMPEAVFHFADHPNDFEGVRKIQRRILDSYQLDFAKHAPKEQVIRISEVFSIIPSQLAKENRKFVFTAISKSARAREYSIALQWLKDARIILRSTQISDIELPLASHSDPDVFKVFLLDVGLLGAMFDLPMKALTHQNELFSSFKGALAEDFVAQELTAYGKGPLYYWTSQGKAEVDFIIQYQGKVSPLEVKAGEIGRAKSLKVFGEKYDLNILPRSSLLNLKRDGKILNYPLYALHRFPLLNES